MPSKVLSRPMCLVSYDKLTMFFPAVVIKDNDSCILKVGEKKPPIGYLCDILNVIHNVGNRQGWVTIIILGCAKHLQDALSLSRSDLVYALAGANDQKIYFNPPPSPQLHGFLLITFLGV